MQPNNPEISGQGPIPQPNNGNIVPNASDVVILVMGLTGSGKSSFINAIPGKIPMVVGYEMESCTTSIVTVEVDTSKFPDCQLLKNRRLILVDTPGFDDTYTDSPDILKQVGEWLGDSYRDKVVLGGLIHIHDISIDRFSGTARKSLVVFNRLCGKEAIKHVVIGTTKSSRLSADVAMKREALFKDNYWKDMIDKGAQVFAVNDGDSHQACKMVSAVLGRLYIEDLPVLHIQRELVDERKSIHQTLAWKTAWEFLAAWTATLGNVWRAGRRLGLS